MNLNDQESLASSNVFAFIVLAPLFFVAAILSSWVEEFLPGSVLTNIIFLLPLAWLLYFYVRLYLRSKANSFKPFPVVDTEKIGFTKVLRDCVTAIGFLIFATLVIFVASDWAAAAEPEKYARRDFFASVLIAIGVSTVFIRRAYISCREYKKSKRNQLADVVPNSESKGL